MKKLFLTSVMALVTCNAYATFDFDNYVPTLTDLYNQGLSAVPSGYTLTFTETDDTSAPIFYNDKYYTYTYNTIGASSPRIAFNSDSDIVGNFFNLSANEQGGAIKNGSHKNSITGDFIGDFTSYNGAAIYNTGIIDSIIGDFINNNANGGGTINNVGTIGSITSVFVDNSAGWGNGAGGAIKNGGTIDSITGVFVGNSANLMDTGGAIWNMGIIDSIIGDFINNTAHISGGAIYNTYINDDYGIGSINGNFSNNSANNEGGAIWNDGGINSITGNFSNNSANDNGGAIFNGGTLRTISSITGVFASNSAGSGGAIFNVCGNIASIDGDFFNNSASSNGSAIYNDDMSCGTTIDSISGNFTNNTVTNGAGYAVYSTNSLKFVSNNSNYTISDNYGKYSGTRYDYGIRFADTLTFENNTNTHYTVNDIITASTSGGLVVTGDGTGYTAFNNNLGNVSMVNINGGKMVFGRTPAGYTGTVSRGRFTDTNPTMNLTNGTFDIANGYTETITLNNLVSNGNNNTIRIDLDINSGLADTIVAENTIMGQIKLVVNALSDLDIDDTIIWFANAQNDTGDIVTANTFVLSSVENLSYDLDIVFDSANKKWGLQKNAGTPTPAQSTQSETPVVAPALVQMADYVAGTVTHTVKKLTDSMHKRVGELRWLLDTDADSGADLNNAFWTRGIYKNFDAGNTSAGVSGLEFGYDRIVSATDNYKWYVGGLGYISGGNSKFQNTTLDITGYGIGAYVMMLEKSGWFTDLVFRQHFINLDTNNVSVDYSASSFNLEFGKEFVFDTDADELKWFVKPAVEGTYISVSGIDIGSFRVQDSTVQTLSLSVIGGPRWNLASGNQYQAYGKIGYHLDNSDDVDVVINSVNTRHTVTTDTLETGIGFNYRGVDNSTNLYFEASYITGTDYSEMSGNLGFRYAF